MLFQVSPATQGHFLTEKTEKGPASSSFPAQLNSYSADPNSHSSAARYFLGNKPKPLFGQGSHRAKLEDIHLFKLCQVTFLHVNNINSLSKPHFCLPFYRSRPLQILEHWPCPGHRTCVQSGSINLKQTVPRVLGTAQTGRKGINLKVLTPCISEYLGIGTLSGSDSLQ